MIARPIISLAVLLLSVVCLAAADPAGKGSVTGKVVLPDGRSAADCIVTLQQDSEKMREAITGSTDSDGKFTLENVPEGDYNLNVRTRDLKGKAIKSLSVVGGKTTDIGKLTLRMK